MKPLIQSLLMTILLIVSANCSVNAQEKNDFESLSLEDLLNVKITTVSKTSQRAAEAPATVIVITAKQIATRHYRNLTEILNDLTDVKVNDKSDPQSFNTFAIRGIIRQDRFVILMDGIKISSPTNEGMPLLENFPIYLAKQVEVVFGPGSALYGADAMSGVINIITDKGEGSEQFKVSTVAGSQGYSNQQLFLRKTLKDGMNLTVAGQYNYDRQPDFSKIYPKEFSMQAQQTGHFNSSYGLMTATQPVDAAYSAPIRTHNMYLSLDKGGFDFKLLHHYAQVPSSTTLKPDNGVFNKNVFYGQGVTTANLSYTDSIGNIKSLTSVQGSWYDVNPKSNFRNLYGGMEHGYKYANGSMIKLDEQLSGDITRNMKLMGGMTFELFKSLPKSVELQSPHKRGGAVEGILLNSTDVYNPGGIAAKFYHLSYNNKGSFVQLQYSPHKKISTTAGVRYDHNSRFGSTVNPRIGVVYNHSAKTTIKALYGTAYWAPSPHTSYEQYGSFYTADSGRTYRSAFWHLPNPGLKPTTSQTSEISISQQVTKNVNVVVTGYYTLMRDLIIAAADNGNTDLYNNSFLGYPVDFVEVPVNSGIQKNWGGNITVNSVFRIGRSKFNAWTSLSLIDGTVLDNTTSSKQNKVEIPFISPCQFRAGVDGTSGDFTYSVTLLRSGQQRITGFKDPAQPYERQVLPGYTLMNISAGYSFANHFTLFTKVQNALDQRYRNPIYVDLTDNYSITTPGSLQDPLRIMAGLTFSL